LARGPSRWWKWCGIAAPPNAFDHGTLIARLNWILPANSHIRAAAVARDGIIVLNLH
jgi:hypothetical protein